MRFYGLSPAQIDEMSVEDYQMCYEAMSVIQASEQLSNIQAAAICDMKPHDRTRIINRLRRDSDLNSQETRAITQEEMARLLNG